MALSQVITDDFDATVCLVDLSGLGRRQAEERPTVVDGGASGSGDELVDLMTYYLLPQDDLEVRVRALEEPDLRIRTRILIERIRQLHDEEGRPPRGILDRDEVICVGVGITVGVHGLIDEQAGHGLNPR